MLKKIKLEMLLGSIGIILMVLILVIIFFVINFVAQLVIAQNKNVVIEKDVIQSFDLAGLRALNLRVDNRYTIQYNSSTSATSSGATSSVRDD
jgi:hypothetical protein